MRSLKQFLPLSIGFLVMFHIEPLYSKSLKSLDQQTKEHLLTTLKNEAFAHLTYMLYAEKARSEGMNDLAQVFERKAKIEAFEHFREQAELYGLVKSNVENLTQAIKGETFESNTLYPEYAAAAEAVGDHAVAALYREIANDEKGHAQEFKAMLQRLLQKEKS